MLVMVKRVPSAAISKVEESENCIGRSERWVTCRESHAMTMPPDAPIEGKKEKDAICRRHRYKKAYKCEKKI
jgi:hypothetical protein